MSAHESTNGGLRPGRGHHGDRPDEHTGENQGGRSGRVRSIEGIIFSALLLAFTGVLLVATSALHASSRTVPLAVGVPLAFLLCYRLIRDAIGTRTKGAPSPVAGMRGEASAILWVVGLPLASTLLGFIAGPAVWVTAWTGVRGRERPVIAIAAGVAAAVLIPLVFGKVLGVSLPTGVFGVIR